MSDNSIDENRDDADVSTDSERRESVRVQISSEVKLKAVAHLTTGAGSDLSVGGIYVVTTQDFHVGTLVDVEFTVDAIDRTFQVLGEVRWRQRQPVGTNVRWGLGIAFLNLDPNDRNALEAFVDVRNAIEPEEGPKDVESIEMDELYDERRDDRRVPISTKVTLKTVANLTRAAGSDLSVGGIYVISDQNLSIGSLVDLVFSVEDVEDLFQVAGEVKWKQDQEIGDETRYGLGVEFIGLTSEDRERLESFVERRAPLELADQFDDENDDESRPETDSNS